MPGSVGSPYSELAIAYVQFGQSPSASITVELRHSGAVMIFFESVMPSCCEPLRLVRAVGGRAVRDDEVRRRRSDRGQRRDQVGLALRVADLLGVDAGLLQSLRDHLSRLRDARSVRVDDRRGLRVEDRLRVVAERQEDVRAVAEEDDAGLLTLRRPG